jgi:hypothetical protein
MEGALNAKRIATYSLLAHINNSTVGIKDLSEIFVPLVKRVVSRMSADGVSKGGSILEIKTLVDATYQFDIPFPLLTKIVKKISDEENTPDALNFAFHKDGSFIIKSFTFADYEEVMIDNDSEIELLNDGYQKYLRLNALEPSQQPTIFEFLDSNRLALSEYFAHKKALQPQTDFIVQANFVNSVKDIPKLFGVLRKVYLGSIITSYLEVDYGELKTNLEFILDTNFVISLLDLNSVGSTHTCRQIIEICKRLKYRVAILDVTVDETKALIHRTAETYETTFLAKKIDPESIYNACDRRNLQPTDLERLASKLEEILFSEFGVQLIANTEKFQNIARYSTEYIKYLEIRGSKLSALHDATAITYIKEKRGKKAKKFEDATVWFVTNTSHALSHLRTTDYLSEIIRAEDLVNLLWLTNPNVKALETVEIGLTRMVSCAIENSLPSARVIKELDDNIQKYARERIAPEDIVRVAKKIANNTLVSLESLNKKAVESPEQFIKELQQISDRQKVDEQQREREIKEFLIQLRQESEDKLRKASDKLQNFHESELSRAIDDFGRKISETKESSQHKDQALKQSYDSLKKVHASIVNSAENFATRTITLCFGLPVLALIVLWTIIGWSKFESWTFLLTLAPSLIGYIYWIIKRKQYSINSCWEDLKGYKYSKLISSRDFDIHHFQRLQEMFSNRPK